MNTGLNFPSGNPLDPSGNLTPQWRMFFLTLFTRSGGTSGNDTATLQAALVKANANIADLQAEDAQGEPAPDMAAVFGLIHVVEAIAAQAMAAASRQPDERGETGESASVSHLSQRVAELGGQIEHYHADDALRQRIADLEAKLDALAPMAALSMQDLEALAASGDVRFTDASQLTGLGTMATQNASAVAITGGGGTFDQVTNLNGPVSGSVGSVNGSGALGTGSPAVFRTAVASTASSSIGTLYHFAATQNGLAGGAAISTQYGFYAGGSLSGASANYGFVSNVPSGTNNWNLYAQSTAKNYLAGVTLIGTTTDDGSGNKIQVNTGLSINPATTTTAPAAGAAGALPSAPTGYATIRIGGTDRKVAYY